MTQPDHVLFKVSCKAERFIALEGIQRRVEVELLCLSEGLAKQKQRLRKTLVYSLTKKMRLL